MLLAMRDLPDTNYLAAMPHDDAVPRKGIIGEAVNLIANRVRYAIVVVMFPCVTISAWAEDHYIVVAEELTIIPTRFTGSNLPYPHESSC